LHLVSVNGDGVLPRLAAGSKIVVAHGGYGCGAIHVGDVGHVGDIGDVHNIYVGLFHMNAAALAHV
jgi:hypothetical protein